MKPSTKCMKPSTSGNSPKRSAGRGSSGDDRPAGSVDVPTIDIYARLSRAQNGQTITVEFQIEKCTDYILTHGGEVGSVFTDNSLSAWNPKVVRKDWLRLMERLETGATDGVMVYDLYRFSRKVMEGERLLDVAKNGVRVWAMAGEYNLMTADGRSHFRNDMVKAATQSDKTSELTTDGKFRHARLGDPPGGTRRWASAGIAPLTAKQKKEPAWKIKRRKMENKKRVDAEREIARDCIERILAGESIQSLVVELNKRGSAGERAALPVAGGLWTHKSLSGSLSRPAMAGLLIYHGEVFGKLAGVKPVVDRKTWERFVAMMAARKRGRPPAPAHILTNCVRCGDCGYRMIGLKRSTTGSYPDGSPIRDIRCPSPSRTNGESCGRNTMDARVAEAAVTQAVTERLRDPARAELVAGKMTRVQTSRSTIVDRIERLEADADALTKKTRDWGFERVENAVAPIMEELAELQQKLAELGDEDLFGAAADEAVAEWEQVCADCDVDAQRRIIRRVFPNLTLAPPVRKNDRRVERLLLDGPPQATALPG